ncbi:MAG: hypothetical protein JWM04_2315 [Verrucomicrobiales bacterium]|nr:hypothetical protein [Verrucomicrobiales bacterium]
MRKRWKRILVVVILLAPVWFLIFEHFRGQYLLASYKKELARKGQTLDIKQLLSPRSAAENNGLPEFLRLTALLPKTSAVVDNYPPKMKLISPGKAVVSLRLDSWIEEGMHNKLTTNTWAPIEKDLEANQTTLENLRNTLTKPVFQSSNDFSNGFEFSGLYAQLVPAKQAAQWFSTATQNSIRQGDFEGALDNLISGLNADRVLEKDGVAITELVHIAISYINFNASWEALQTNTWTDSQLSRLQLAWENTPFAKNMALSLQRERAGEHSYYYPLFKKSTQQMHRHLYNGGMGDDDTPNRARQFMEEQVLSRIWRFAWMDQDSAFSLREMQKLIDQNAPGAAANDNDPLSYGIMMNAISPSKASAGKNFYNKLRYAMSGNSVTNLSSLPAKAARAETQKSLVITAIALMRYQHRNGKPPQTINDLSPDFVKSIPLDYMDGKPIRYKLNADGTWTIYSVGANGTDEHGDASPLKPNSSYRSIWDGKDAVWPSPATSEEFLDFQNKSYKSKSTKKD